MFTHIDALTWFVLAAALTVFGLLGWARWLS
jgi:hypothetical protein